MAGITLGDAIFFFRGDRTDVTQKLHETERLVKDGSGRINGFLRDALAVALGNTIAAGLQAATSAIGGFFAGTVSAAASFEERLSGIKAVLSPTTAEMEKLRAKALELGQTTAFSASQSAEAIEMLAKNGLDATAILNGAADATVALAAATGADLSTAADIMTDAMAIFGIAAEDAGAAIDGITGVTVASKFSINDYRLALAQAGGVAASVGVEFDDFNTSIAAISPLFASGSDAGTAYKTMLQRLVPASGPAKQAMQELGLIAADGSNQFFNANGQLKDMSEVAGILQRALAPLSEEQKNVALSTIFGTDAMRAAVGLANVGTDGFNELAASMAEVDAAAQAATRLDNFNGALEQARGAAETLQITLGSYLLPVLTRLLNNVVTPGINTLTTLTNALAGNAEAFGQLPAPLQAVVSGLQQAVQWLSGLRAPLGVAADRLGSFIARLRELAPLAAAIFRQLAEQALGWGANITGQLAAGIGQAAAVVVAQLQRIGAIIRHWLAPRSPPLIVPELDQYGRDAAQLYADSWGEADFSALQQLGRSIQEVLEGLVKRGELGETDLIPTLLGGRDALSRAITEFREFGDVSEEALQAVVSAAGPAGPAVEGLVRSYFDLQRAAQDVAAAQEELNRVTEAYSDKLDPLNAELAAIKDRQQEIRDMQRIEKLQQDLAEGKLEGHDAELAQLEIAEIGKRRQIEGIEEERDAAVDAAQQKLDAAEAEQRAAEDRYRQQQDLLSAQREQNDLIQQQIDLLARLAEEQRKAAEAAAAGGGAGGGGGGAGVDSLLGAIGPLPDTASPVEAVKQEVAGALAETTAQVEQELSDAEQMALAALERARQQARQAVEQQAAEILAAIGAGVQRAITEGPRLLLGFVEGMLQRAPEAIGQLQGLSTQLLTGLLPQQEQVRGTIGQVLVGLVGAIGEHGPAIIAAAGQWAVALLSFAALAAPQIITQMGAIAAQLVGAIGQAAPGILAAFGAVALNMAAAFVAGVPGILAAVATAGAGVIGELGAALPGIIAAVGEWALWLAGFAVQALPGLLGNLGAAVGQLLDALGTALPGIVESLATWAAAFVEWAIIAAPRLMGELLNLLSALLGWIVERAPGIAGQLGEWALRFIEWVGPTAAKLLLALGEMFGQILLWAAQSGPGLMTTFQTEWVPAISAWVADAALRIIQALDDFLTELLGWIGDGAADVLRKAAEIGDAVVSGIRKGIQDKWEGLKSWFQGLVKSVIGAGKDAIEAKSPSRAAARELGIPIVEGIIAGLEQMVPALLAAAEGLGEKLIGQLKATAEKARDALRDLAIEGLQGEQSLASQDRRNLERLRRFAEERAKILADQAKLDEAGQEARAKLADEEASSLEKQAELRARGEREAADALQRREAIERDYQRKVEDAERKQADLQQKLDAETDADKRAALLRQMEELQRSADREHEDYERRIAEEEQKTAERQGDIESQLAAERARIAGVRQELETAANAAEVEAERLRLSQRQLMDLEVSQGRLEFELQQARERAARDSAIDSRVATQNFQRESDLLFQMAEARRELAQNLSIDERAFQEQRLRLLEQELHLEQELGQQRLAQAQEGRFGQADQIAATIAAIQQAQADAAAAGEEAPDATDVLQVLQILFAQLITGIAQIGGGGNAITINTAAPAEALASILQLLAQPRT